MRRVLLSLAIVAIVSSAYAEEVEGLVLALTFDDVGALADLSDEPADVAINGKLMWAPGAKGQALEFDGNNANLVEISHADKLAGMTAMTITAWFQTRDFAAAEGMSIMSKRLAWQQGDAYNLFIWTGQTVRARVNGAGEIITATAIEDDTWYHVAYVFDADGGAEAVKLILDGVVEAVGAHPGPEVIADESPVWIGELDPNRGFAWNGLIDEVTMWNRALSEDEIAELRDTGIVDPLAVDASGKLATTWGGLRSW